jgi:Tol biopolymer transport system component
MSSTGTDAYKVCDAVSPSDNRSPSFTPDGDEIVFEAVSTSGDGAIYRVDALPDARPRLTALKGVYPKCDYISGRVLYSKYRTSGYVLAWQSLNGDDEEILTELTSDDLEPRYRPDGVRIAFSSNRTGSYKVYTMTAAGAGATLVTNFAGNHRHPSYDPAGTTIVFTNDATGTQDIYTVPAGGGSATRLTTSTGEDYRPCYNHDGTKIAFVSTRNGKASIHVMDANGDNQVAIATQGNCDWPAVSPDGTLVTFVSDRSGEWKLYYVPIGGGDAVAVDTGAHQVYAAAWKSDGSEIAYVGGSAGAKHLYRRATPLNAHADVLPVREDGECSDLWWGESDAQIVFSSNIDGQFEVYKITANGADEVRVADTEYADAYDAAWSYDGTQVAYATRAFGGENIIKVTAGTTSYTRLTTGSYSDRNPHWEPNSTSRIVFQSDRPTTTNLGLHKQVWRMASDGTSLTQLTFGDHDSLEPQWSPSGASIVFAANPDGNYRLYTMLPDGTGVSQLTTGEGDHRQPSYSPDGLSVIYQSDETGEWQVYSVVISSGLVTRLTQSTAQCTEPSWSSDGEFVYYTRDDGEQTRSVWRVSALGTVDEQWYAPEGAAVYSPAVTEDDAFGGAFAQDPSTWEDLPVSRDTALDMGYAKANVQRVGHSRKLAIAIKVPSGEPDQTVSNLRLLASFKPQ